MSKMLNTERVVQLLGRWYPGDLAFIDGLEYRCAAGEQRAQLRLAARFQRRDSARNGWPNDSDPYIKVTMLFIGVADFQVRALGPSPKQITGFEIRDVSDSGWEGVRLSVEDYEDGQVSFRCAEALIEEVSS